MPKRIEVTFQYEQYGRIDETLFLNPVQIEVIRQFFSNSWAPSKARVFLQYADHKKVRIEVFSSFPKDIKEAGIIFTNLLNSPRAIKLARKSLKLQGKPLR
jgi:hypothetical protein